MIVSASRRTDIPAFYSEWLFNRLRDGFACARNPMNPRQVSRVSLAPADASCIVFWTKNPAPMLGLLGGRPCRFQFTLTPYSRDIEPKLPQKDAVVVESFRSLARALGPENVNWRYDPILINQKYTARFHARAFAELAEALRGHARNVTISFVDAD